ncbi:MULTISPECIES: phosphonate C-P lyase system protein PhnH [Rhodopseudomonas]|uniref:Protein phnH n=1 Tax=Rhodopseudomonas palustris TaxID=1076 RepID=A0A0D7EVF8_RHOPL|nr:MULTISPECIES: phosphonate C-P lyase system protein PhnH [Rhodopseudomonas]KIZ44646.1 protein phnH [Rhodopseudomonas palustris]MDF3810564.1 phosphonate C-P lyase system protein PhnH [Rhodopseudomonas sp. BAL398]WOK17313.1 phosphonate C-P lyase system protein PhnH [Rhodopseudomonas sp. BAL398]
MTTLAELSVGFADKVLSAQSTFRAVMEAMARPGEIHQIKAAVDGAPPPLMPASAAIALTLFDHDTPIWLDAAMADRRDLAKWLKFHCSAPVVADPSIASFALIADPAAMPSLDGFALGSAEYPDRSTTLIVQIHSLRDGPAIELSGPGIRGCTSLKATIAPELLAQLAGNRALFPRGVDLVLVAGDCVLALPRTTRLAATGG